MLSFKVDITCMLSDFWVTPFVTASPTFLQVTVDPRTSYDKMEGMVLM